MGSFAADHLVGDEPPFVEVDPGRRSPAPSRAC